MTTGDIWKGCWGWVQVTAQGGPGLDPGTFLWVEVAVVLEAGYTAAWRQGEGSGNGLALLLDSGPLPGCSVSPCGHCGSHRRQQPGLGRDMQIPSGHCYIYTQPHYSGPCSSSLETPPGAGRPFPGPQQLPKGGTGPLCSSCYHKSPPRSLGLWGLASFLRQTLGSLTV